MRLVARPIDQWPGALYRDRARTWPTFRASWTDTVDLLARETEQLGAEEVVVQLAVTDSDLRLDGWIRANARPEHPGVIVSFDSRYGPLRYHTDQFTSNYDMAGWQANVRAIALGLEALRKVDRYGISKDGEQYRGWNALPPGRPMDAPMTFEQAAAFLTEHAWGPDVDPQEAIDDLDGAYRAAAKQLHPDAGGDPALFRRLTEARELLEAHGG